MPPDLELDLVQHCVIHSVVADEKRSSVTMVRTKPSLKAAAEKAARDDGRSLSSLIEKLLTEHLRAAGYLQSQHPEPR